MKDNASRLLLVICLITIVVAAFAFKKYLELRQVENNEEMRSTESTGDVRR
jgi:hypothetical protein